MPAGAGSDAIFVLHRLPKLLHARPEILTQPTHATRSEEQHDNGQNDEQLWSAKRFKHIPTPVLADVENQIYPTDCTHQ